MPVYKSEQQSGKAASLNPHPAGLSTNDEAAILTARELIQEAREQVARSRELIARGQELRRRLERTLLHHGVPRKRV